MTAPEGTPTPLDAGTELMVASVFTVLDRAEHDVICGTQIPNVGILACDCSVKIAKNATLALAARASSERTTGDTTNG